MVKWIKDLMADLIQPRTLKGFRDYPPPLAIPRERLMDIARRVFRSYGFAPIDTPALEYAEILVGKMAAEAEIQRQLYRFQDQGDRDVALRFDLTVPFARFAAQHINTLGTPFKRYHIGPVWRGEAPQARAVIANSSSAISTQSVARENAADIEIGPGHPRSDGRVLQASSGFDIRINNRLVLNGLLEELGLAGQAGAGTPRAGQTVETGPGRRRRRVDRRRGEPRRRRCRPSRPSGVMRSRQHDREQRRSPRPGRARLRPGIAKAAEGVTPSCANCWPSPRRPASPTRRICAIDLSICRGLDYYTGTIYETFLTDLPGIGSVCSGGRYDNLASLYTKQVLPGVGASLGLDPAARRPMEELNLAAEGLDAGPGADRTILGRAARRLPAAGADAPGRRHRDRGISRRQEDRAAIAVCRKARVHARRDRRAGRVRGRRVQGEGAGHAERNAPCRKPS